ncbi:MAG: bifunctional phosphopantothenoylcysteine decarboxylase/phosphopantothenate--cysteine ligase CoaBC [Phenylobacterium sp.]|uniref:bifunctional phosphopantothenoylcysteine decarboxylase/phosphopantothenate--cysteine ligase CoaBC n=1 Tax=Phenylobacterium sp. TaxID=1871053 RepID=UPI001B76C149|nr:bifunctional phosphopantothenoylcysteine decarboxylase/phosphopantothenate--cysteine ligase CoaBC [Phenylobacterium sp.]MBP7817609.1 bifunctional phosphopantothenoylcysteine decarboxylase/phosphopantothenate--cysteine ligase CoaBC [Phenylobacterium sp.]MBP9232540.1 bifunctional phosphopantothenoylcysteine decarboxylase/phosphopantothenate--cysteine ligase CoaBC [Phenylobacterium sp.]MBP9755888.1 bifunctional phosphopantothenoylcysteine decarboxylase/phosphopantothenate--cysteine ligase CoaBC 
MSEKRILLIVGGGIAAYKSLELVRLLRKAGVAVRPILTAAGAQFVTPLSLSALCEDRVYSELFSLDDESEMGHIQLSRSADLVVVAPATADLMAKAANGLAGDLASTTLLATDKRVLMAPAMNVRMWSHPATQRNLKTLAADGVSFVGPDEGAMACGEFGPGRLAEPPEIFAAIMKALEGPTAKPLAGRRAIVTAGPTAEPIDPVRVLTNRSSGKQGFAIAAALAELGCDVTLVAGPVAVATPLGVKRVNVETAREMLAACEAALPADIAVCVAAVSDWRPEVEAGSKMKKGAGGPPALKLVENPDILATLSNGFPRPKLVVGFAAETDNVEAYAQAKLARKGCDWIVANDVSIEGAMGGDENTVSIVTPEGIERWERTAKSDVARKLAARMAKELS